MSTPFTGVYPCYENQFGTGAAGGQTVPANAIANCETFSVAINGNIVEWSPFEEEGWLKRAMTGKDIVITVTAKRTYGDTGNDLIADCAFSTMGDAELDFAWAFPDGSQVWFKNAVISVTNLGTGDSRDLGKLEFTVSSNGKPNFIPAA